VLIVGSLRWWLLPFPRVETGMCLFQVGDGEPEVTLGGDQGAMAQQILHMAQVGVVLDRMGSAGVAPDVTRDMFLHPGQFGMARDQGPNG
jgi:hypothetical protein